MDLTASEQSASRDSQHAWKTITSEYADAILRVSAFHITTYDHAVISFEDKDFGEITASLSSDFPQRSSSLGTLAKLPTELLHEICLSLDIKSLFRFRHTNSQCRSLVNALHENRVIIRHARDTCCALLRTGSAPLVTLSEFYRLLCTQRCFSCDRYGNYAFLLDWRRVCTNCMGDLSKNNPRHKLVDPSRPWQPLVRVFDIHAVRSRLPLPEETLLDLPTLTTISGRYFSRRYFHGGFALVSMHRTVTALEKQIGEPVPGQKYYGLRARPWQSFAASCVFPVYDPRTRRADSGVSCAGCQLRIQERIDAEDVQDMPYTQFGHMIYLRDEFLEHFGTCEYAQKLWLESKEGTVEPRSFPEACRRGDYARPPPSEWDRTDWNL